MSIQVWPLTIINDKWDGKYSNAKYLAIESYHDDLHRFIIGTEPENYTFWTTYLCEEYPIGKGSTPILAYKSLLRQLKEREKANIKKYGKESGRRYT